VWCTDQLLLVVLPGELKMKSRSSGSKWPPADARSASTRQALALLQQFVDLIASGMVVNMQDLPEVCGTRQL